MNRLMFAAGACSAALAASVTFSGAAFADPEEPAPAVDGTASQGPSAAAEIARLQSEGKSVQVVGNDGAAPLESCVVLSLIHISEPTRLSLVSRMPSSA